MLVVLSLLSATFAQSSSQSTDAFFESRIRPVLATHCYSCHSATAKTPFAGLRVDSRDALLRGGDHGPAIVPGKPDQSRLIQAVRHQTIQMPPSSKLPAGQIDDLVRWVESGAPWPVEKATSARQTTVEARAHWAWQPFAGSFAHQNIDAFVRASLQANGMQPSPRADRRTLLRRLSYDLTGLPPSPADASLDDAALVDKLLASPQFGERWGRHWLDLARYSDAGFNNVRFPYAFTYRDWVVQAFNDDMPYDQFAMRQIAADQMTGEPRHLAALGMLSLGLNPPRATSIPERLDDRIDAVSRSFLGLTVSCARCHDHKYDPIPTRDYYSLYGVFANTEEPWIPAGLGRPADRASQPRPIDSFYSDRLAARRAIIDGYKAQRIEEHRAEARQPALVRKYLLTAWESRDMSNPQVEHLSRERNVDLLILRRWRDWLRSPEGRDFTTAAATDPVAAADTISDRLASTGALAKPGAPPNVPLSAFPLIQTEGDGNTVNNLRWQYDRISADYAYRGSPPMAMHVLDKPEIVPAHVFIRGNMNDLGDPVERQFLSILGGQKFSHGSGRLDLARAIVRTPLAARVMVNRVWQHLFGEGLVRTVSDFGTRGDPPTHPELLDFLARQFVSDGWSVKRLIRRIVLSETYRQSSADHSAFRSRDPDNRLLWRMNRRRLDFEALRDSMLAVAGNLDTSLGGPPFVLSAIPAAPRRTLYAFIERERANQLLKSFNVADPEQHTPQRHLTTVPQQALFLLNSPFLAEQARRLADRAANTGELYRLALGRDPSPEELRDAAPFLSREAPPPAPKSPWRYGWGAFDPSGGKVTRFEEFRYFVDQAYQAGPVLPDREAGNVFLTATGGAPGEDLQHVVIRRWVAPVDATVSIAGTLTHAVDIYERRFKLTNGIRAWAVSSRSGILGSWAFGVPSDGNEPRKLETSIASVPVRAGDTIDFIVDSNNDYESDDFAWAPVIRAAATSWSAQTDFHDPAPLRLSPWEQLAQVLLLTNEFAFID